MARRLHIFECCARGRSPLNREAFRPCGRRVGRRCYVTSPRAVAVKPMVAVHSSESRRFRIHRECDAPTLLSCSFRRAASNLLLLRLLPQPHDAATTATEGGRHRMCHLATARGPPFGPRQLTGTAHGGRIYSPWACPLAHSAVCASSGPSARATAPFRDVSTPDGCCTAPSTLALRLSVVHVAPGGELVTCGNSCFLWYVFRPTGHSFQRVREPPTASHAFACTEVPGRPLSPLVERTGLIGAER